MSYTISQAARVTDCPAVTIRYYERVGILPEPRRGANGYRRYEEDDIQRLEFVVRARALGFSLADVTDLLELADHPHRPCDAVDRKVGEQLAAVRRRIERLSELATRLQRLQAACDGDHEIDQCGILAALASGWERKPQ